MANIIKIYYVILFATVWVTEAYSGKRIRRHYEQEESEFQAIDNSIFKEQLSVDKKIHNSKKDMSYNYIKDNSVYDKHSSDEHIQNSKAGKDNSVYDKHSSDQHIQNSKTVMSDHYINNEQKSELNNESNDYVRHTIINNDENDNFEEPPERPSTDIDQGCTETNDTLIDLVIKGARLAQPYFPEHITNLNLDWDQLEVALKTLEHVATYEKGRKSSSASPLMKTARAIASLAEPMIMDYVRSGLEILLDLIDNTAFMTSGHAISKRGVTKSVLDDILDAFTAILEHIGGN